MGASNIDEQQTPVHGLRAGEIREKFMMKSYLCLSCKLGNSYRIEANAGVLIIICTPAYGKYQKQLNCTKEDGFAVFNPLTPMGLAGSL